MRSLLAAILVLAICFLAGRVLWAVDVSAAISATGAKRPLAAEAKSVDTGSSVLSPQRAVRPFAAGPSPSATRAKSPARLPPVAADLTRGREFEFDATSLKRLASGDTFRIDFPPLGGRYEFSVDEVVEKSDGRTIRGHIDYDRREYPSLITLTGGWGFGSFTTPEGNFEFTTRNGMARMVDGAELERRAYAPNDTLIPNRS